MQSESESARRALLSRLAALPRRWIQQLSSRQPVFLAFAAEWSAIVSEELREGQIDADLPGSQPFVALFADRVLSIARNLTASPCKQLADTMILLAALRVWRHS